MKKFFCFLSIILIGIIAEIAHSEDPYSYSEKQYLLNLARQTLCWYVKDNEIPKVNESELPDRLKEKRACFVTLYKKDSGLRGCIGMFEPVNTTLWENVIDRTIAAATKDPRFYKVRPEELKDIKIDISILTAPQDLHFSSVEDLLSKLEPHKHGVILTTKYGSSTYLPQVWEELPNKEAFLSNLCKKHGAPSDYWKREYQNIKVQTYEAIVFEENTYGRKIVGKNGAIVGKKGAFVIGAVKLLPEGIELGSRMAAKGTRLEPGTIITPDSEIIEK